MSRRDFLAGCIAALLAPVTAPTSASAAPTPMKLDGAAHSLQVQLDTSALKYIVDEPSLGRTPLWFILDSGCDICRNALSDLRTHAAIHDRTLLSFELRFVPVGDTPDSAAAAARAFAANSMEGFFVQSWSVPVTPLAKHAQHENTLATRSLPGYPAFVIEDQPVKLGYGGWAEFAEWLAP
ncbi:hypothetical protein [Caballeronia sordidicola]|uniref:hypothetical protein n=1 Tax=Caballeronia sordidicola TaxID=196367 RepID=UPI0004D03B9A|nr:hypothetical protein [Caballeronia sordidicola]